MKIDRLREENKKDDENWEIDNVFFSNVDSLIRLKNYTAAINQLDKYKVAYSKDALDIDVKFVDIGKMYEKDKKIDSALQMYSKAIARSNTNVYALVNRGTIYYKMKNYKAALPDFKRAADMNSDYLYDLGLVQQKLKLYQDADSSFTVFLIENPNCKICKLKIDTMEMKIKKHTSPAN